LLLLLLLLSFDPANRYGKRGQTYFGGACGGRHTGSLSHLRHQRPPGADVERAVHDRVHTRVGAREHEQRVLHLLIDHLRRLGVRPVPVQQKIGENIFVKKYVKATRACKTTVDIIRTAYAQ